MASPPSSSVSRFARVGFARPLGPVLHMAERGGCVATCELAEYLQSRVGKGVRSGAPNENSLPSRLSAHAIYLGDGSPVAQRASTKWTRASCLSGYPSKLHLTPLLLIRASAPRARSQSRRALRGPCVVGRSSSTPHTRQTPAHHRANRLRTRSRSLIVRVRSLAASQALVDRARSLARGFTRHVLEGTHRVRLARDGGAGADAAPRSRTRRRAACDGTVSVARLLRLVRRAKGIRLLLATLVSSLPSPCNVGTLLLLPGGRKRPACRKQIEHAHAERKGRNES